MNDELLQELKNVVREVVAAEAGELRKVVAAEVGALRAEMNAKFDQVDARFEKQQLHIDKRFNVADKQIHELRTDVLDVHSKFSELQSSVDHYVVHAERVGHEQLFTTHATERHERWIKQLAEATEVKLEPAA